MDMTAPAHVLVFRPLIRILRDRGDEVEITARDGAGNVLVDYARVVSAAR